MYIEKVYMYLGYGKVSLIQRCPYFRGVLLEGFHCIASMQHMSMSNDTVPIILLQHIVCVVKIHIVWVMPLQAKFTNK